MVINITEHIHPHNKVLYAFESGVEVAQKVGLKEKIIGTNGKIVVLIEKELYTLTWNWIAGFLKDIPKGKFRDISFETQSDYLNQKTMRDITVLRNEK